jgi:hypothetical protein
MSELIESFTSAWQRSFDFEGALAPTILLVVHSSEFHR